jgi:hypothetical protein
MKDEDLRALSPLPTLTSLSLANWRWPTGLTDKSLRVLALLTALSSLDVGHCDGVKDERLRALIAPLTALISLNLVGCSRVSDKGLMALAPHTTLTTLILCGGHLITLEGVRALVPLTALTRLDLSIIIFGICDEGLRAMSPFAPLLPTSTWQPATR